MNRPQRPSVGYGGYAPILGSGFVSGAARRIEQIGFHSLFNPLSRMSDYGANIACPVVIPNTAELMHAFYAGELTQNQLTTLALCHGVPLARQAPTFDLAGLPQIIREGLEDKLTDIHAAWTAVLKHNEPYYPISLLRKLTRQGVLRDDRLLRNALRKEGFADESVQDLYIEERELIAPSTIFDMWLLGLITDDELVRRLVKLGWSSTDAIDMLRAQDQVPGIGDIHTMLLQGLITDGVADQWLFAHGFQQAGTRQQLLKQRFAMPSMGVLIESVGRQLFDEQFSLIWGLDNEKPATFRTWSARLGMEYSTGQGQFGEQGDDAPTWGDIAWRSHWNLPSVGMLGEILHRFRGDPQQPHTWSTPDVRPLTKTEADRLLAANGIPPRFRPYVYGLMYAPISVRHMRLIIRNLEPTLEEVGQMLMDQGNSPQNALRIATAIMRDEQTKTGVDPVAARRKAHNVLVAAITDAYEVGTIDSGTALRELAANGIPSGVAETMLATVDVQVSNGLAKRVIQRCKADLFAGRTSNAEALQRMVSVGINPTRAGQYIAGWAAEFGEGRKHVATGRILSLLRKGLITSSQAISRLDNLGWAKPDEILLLAEVQGQIAVDASRARKAQELGAQREEREVARLLRQAVQHGKALQSRLRTLTPPAKLVKWYVDDIIGEDDARERLGLLGYTPDVIDAMLLEGLEHGRGKRTRGQSGEREAGSLDGTGNGTANGGA